MQPHRYVKNLIASLARDHARRWVEKNVQADEGTKAVAVLVVAGKIEEIVNHPASGEFGFRKAHLYLNDCKFEHSKLVHTPREPMEQVLAVR